MDQLVLGVLAMTPITGAFADPTHESALRAAKRIGSKANVVKIVVRLARWFGVEDEVREKLGVKQSRAAKLDAEIVDRLADGLLFRMAHPLRILLLALCLTIAGFMASRLALRLYDLQ